MNWIDVITTVFIISGCFFFGAGTLGLIRLPDVFTRLHALTKADNLGLGLIIIGIAFQSDSAAVVVKLALIWLLVLISSASISHLIGRAALQQGLKPWVKKT